MQGLAEDIKARNHANVFYLWVLDVNYAAISFYDRIGGQRFESVEANDIGDKIFSKTRYVWSDMDTFLKLVASKKRE